MAKCKHHPGKAGVVTHGGVSYCEDCKKQIETAVLTVHTHVTPRNCFVTYKGTKEGWRTLSGTGCAHWVSHEKGFKGNKKKCLDGFSLVVEDVMVGKVIEPENVEVGNIWASIKGQFRHCGIVSKVEPPKGDGEEKVPKITIENCSSGSGKNHKTVQTDWTAFWKRYGKGKFYTG